MEQIAEEEAKTGTVTQHRKRNESASQAGESEADDDYDNLVSYSENVHLLIHSLNSELTNTS
jgi:hypothetical protein